jgi:hypothetical protein
MTQARHRLFDVDAAGRDGFEQEFQLLVDGLPLDSCFDYTSEPQAGRAKSCAKLRPAG